MIKNIECLKKEIGELPCVDTVFISGGSSYIDSAVPVMAVYDLLDKLDEPEANSQINKLANFIMSEVEGEPSQNQGVVDTAIRIIKSYQNQETLSQEWIDEHSETFKEIEESMVPLDKQYIDKVKVQKILVPKQEELESKIKVLIETYKQEDGAYSNLENGWIGGFIEDLKNLVEEEQKYYVYLGDGQYLVSEDGLKEHYAKIRHEEDIGFSNYVLTFTEQEIKDYDPRYMTFAKSVEEFEE